MDIYGLAWKITQMEYFWYEHKSETCLVFKADWRQAQSSEIT